MKPPRTLAGAALAVALAVAAAAPAGAASIQVDRRYPAEGERAVVRVIADDGAPVTGALVRVTYRPGSSVETHAEVGRTDAGGAVAWTPELAGIATLSAEWTDGSASANVSVRFHHAPVAGLVIMIVAGVILVGGSVVRIRRVLLEPDGMDAA